MCFRGVLLFGGVMTLAASLSVASPYVESFAGASGTFDGATAPYGFSGGGTPGIPGFTGLPSAGSFGGTTITLVDDDATDFPNAPDNKYVKWAGDSDRYALLGAAGYATVLAGTEGVINTAFAVRVDSLSPTAANNDIQIFRVGLGAGLFITRLDAADGALKMIAYNGMAADLSLGTQMTSGAADTWEGKGWRVVAIRNTLDVAAATSTLKVWDVSSGSPVLLGSAPSYQATVATGVTHYGFGAAFDIPSGTAAVSISVDEVTIWPTTDAPDEAGFLARVQAHYFAPSTVDEWLLYR